MYQTVLRKIKDLTVAIEVFNQILTEMLKYRILAIVKKAAVYFQNLALGIFPIKVLDYIVRGGYF